jgi:thymidylate kinase
MKILALEGLSFCGKSSVATSLASKFTSHNVAILREYADLVPTKSRPPIPSKSVDEELSALEFYLRVEADRWNQLGCRSADLDLVIQDRCYHTLLAHTYAVSKLHGWSKCFDDALRIVNADPTIRKPHLVILLEASIDTLTKRYLDIPNSLAPILKEPNYISLFTEYFSHHCSLQPHLFVAVDANGPLERLNEMVVSAVARSLLCVR